MMKPATCGARDSTSSSRDAVVADLGARHRDDLPGVRRIGQHFLVAGHARVEHDLAAGLAGRAGRLPFVPGAVFERECGFHASLQAHPMSTVRSCPRLEHEYVRAVRSVLSDAFERSRDARGLPGDHAGRSPSTPDGPPARGGRLRPVAARPGCSGVTPTSLPSTKTRAPRGRESTYSTPVVAAGGFDGLAGGGDCAVRASGAGARVGAWRGRSVTSNVRDGGARRTSVTSSRATSYPGCTTRTTYLPNLRSPTVRAACGRSTCR